MAKCPWFPKLHAAAPDPKVLGLEVGEIHVCLNCQLFYWVKSAQPYVLRRAFAPSAAVISALSTHGKPAIRADYAALLKNKEVTASLSAKLKYEP